MTDMPNVSDIGMDIAEKGVQFAEYLTKDLNLTGREKFLLRHFLFMLVTYVETRKP